MKQWLVLAALVAMTLAGCLGDDDAPDADGDGFTDAQEIDAGTDPNDPLSMPGVTPYQYGDVTVLAIVDSAFNPYHHDFAAALMPQHVDTDPTNDLPLDQPPHTWLPGFPDPSTFASYEAMDLTISDDPEAVPDDLHTADAEQWAKAETSNAGAVHYRYIPGTKVIGYVNTDGDDGYGAATHGGGTTSVSVGNIHGSCPECLLVFVDGYSAMANPWMAQQSWIDVQSNSWGASTAYRENIYTNCDLDTLAAGVARGQQIFWSGGNGQANAFIAPVNTLNSCQKGPDFLVTVGAISPDNEGSYTGHGKPVDIASWGSDYPRAGGATVTAEGTFGGTSNAAPTTAGMFAKSLWTLRNQLGGERIQADGVIAHGTAGCGEANMECALADGLVTVHELREAFFRAATPTDALFTTSTLGLTPDPEIPVGTQETEYLTEGHGSFRARLGDLDAEIASIVAEVTGEAFDAPSQDLLDYMAAYSYCSQQVWGSWDHGYWSAGDALPGNDPNRPITSWMASLCPDTMNALLLPFR